MSMKYILSFLFIIFFNIIYACPNDLLDCKSICECWKTDKEYLNSNQARVFHKECNQCKKRIPTEGPQMFVSDYLQNSKLKKK